MKLPHPTACDPTAYRFFAAQLPALSTDRGLLRAAIAISMHELPQVDVEVVENQMQILTDNILARVTNRLPDALLAHMHDELFEELGLVGNWQDYYQSENSYVSRVLETGLGIPISLSLVYTLVARNLGLRADGVNSPGHFLVQIAAGGKPMFVDPFHRGELLTREEALRRIASVTGRAMSSADDYLRPATHPQWIARMLHNLVNVFAANGRGEDAAAMTDMLRLMDNAIF